MRYSVRPAGGSFLLPFPLLNYWWLRWIWKIILWSYYLFRMSRFRLRLLASHPDRTGGIGFLSDVQTRFGLVILAYGITNVASTIAYKMAFEGATLGDHSVWGPLVGFVISAPLLFTDTALHVHETAPSRQEASGGTV